MTEAENPHHEMKKCSAILGCGWASERISKSKAKRQIFTTPLLHAESKYEYSVSQFWFRTAAETNSKNLQTCCTVIQGIKFVVRNEI